MSEPLGYLQTCLNEAEASFAGQKMKQLFCINCGGFLIHNIGERVMRNICITSKFCVVCEQTLTESMRTYALEHPQRAYNPPELHECDTTFTSGICRIPHVFRYNPHPYTSVEVIRKMYQPHARASLTETTEREAPLSTPSSSSSSSSEPPVTSFLEKEKVHLSGVLLPQHIYTMEKEYKHPARDSLRVHWMCKKEEPPEKLIKRVCTYDPVFDPRNQTSDAEMGLSPQQQQEVLQHGVVLTTQHIRFDEIACRSDEHVYHNAWYERCNPNDVCRGCNQLLNPSFYFFKRYCLANDTSQLFCTVCRQEQNRLDETDLELAAKMVSSEKNERIYRLAELHVETEYVANDLSVRASYRDSIYPACSNSLSQSRLASPMTDVDLNAHQADYSHACTAGTEPVTHMAVKPRASICTSILGSLWSRMEKIAIQEKNERELDKSTDAVYKQDTHYVDELTRVRPSPVHVPPSPMTLQSPTHTFSPIAHIASHTPTPLFQAGLRR
jgi:hypothetical protein